MKIAIRMDDITPDMDWAKFFRFREICDSYQVKPLLGVVPDNQDALLHIGAVRDDFWEYLLQLQKEGWCIAQHGCTHIYSTKKRGCFPLNALSEYAGRSYEEQMASLRAGKSILEAHNIYTDIFMAPAHSYDRNTLRALKALGLTKVTDGFGSAPYRWKGISFYPISFAQNRSLKQKKGCTTFVVHVNTMSDRDFERYESLFAQYKDRLISFGEYLKITPQRRGRLGHIREYLMAYGKWVLVSIRSRVGKNEK